MQMRIILASQSPRRQHLLDQLGLQYEVLPSNIEETMPPSNGRPISPAQITTELARQKAFAIGDRLNKDGMPPPDKLIIIGADTIVVLDDKLYNKPNSTAEAKAMLQALCGRTHQVYTGIALLVFDFAKSSMECLTESETSLVTFRTYTEPEIDAYIETGEPMDKAGAYALQGTGAFLIAKVDGCYTNIIGLPLPKVVKMLRAVGVEVLGQ